MIVYLAQDIPAYVMYCVNGESGSSLLIESTDSMIYMYIPFFLVLISALYTRYFLHAFTYTHSHSHSNSLSLQSPLNQTCTGRDSDRDGISDGCDNCPSIFNPSQTPRDCPSLRGVCSAHYSGGILWNPMPEGYSDTKPCPLPSIGECLCMYGLIVLVFMYVWFNSIGVYVCMV